jgi:hypothetical protein
MSINTRSAGVECVLRRHAPADLYARWHPGTETFVEVAPGKPVLKEDGKPARNTYTADGFTYYQFRLQAAGDETREITYPLSEYWFQVGISGWDYLQGVATAVGYDFDDLLSHQKAGLPPEKLEAVREAIKKLPYAEFRRSTGGGGFHVWITFPADDLPKVTSRTEMKALARAVLARMSQDTGHHFEADVDHLGDILWICSRRTTPESQGLTLVHAAERPMTEWPRDFKEHMPVVTRQRQKTVLRGTTAEESDAIEKAHKDRVRVPLDDAHRKFIEAYEATGFYGYWDEDHGCFVGHTAGFLNVTEALKLTSVYQTVSDGRHPGEPNAWVYPLKFGGWRAFRFTAGTPEAPTWETSRSGWTTCVIGLRPAPSQVARRHGGVSKGKAFVFVDPDKAALAALTYGVVVKYPVWLETQRRPVTMEIRRDGLNLSIPRKKSDPKQAAHDAGWIEVRGPIWTTGYACETVSQTTDYEGLADDTVRHVARDAKQLGLYVHTTQGWHQQSPKQVENHLSYKDIVGGQQVDVLGWCSDHPWNRVALPFQPEQPGDRQWNLDGCQLAHQPADHPGPTPNWDRLFAHWGQGLDDAVAADDWCRDHGIKDGAMYLQFWFANWLRYPERRLPMLATYSAENNTGKSFIHEAGKELITQNGYMLSEKAIKNKSGFDAELHGKVLCGIDDVDLGDDVSFYNTLKRWITNPWMNYGYKGKEVFLDRNYTHWVIGVQTRKFIPIDRGDERITLWEMVPFPKSEMVPKDEMRERINREAPFLLQRLFALDLREVHSRLAIPALLTTEKSEAMSACEAQPLEGIALKAFEAINNMSKPWGPGTATALSDHLGNWDGSTKQPTQRANSLGRYMPRIAQRHGKIDITTDGKVRLYYIRA